MLHFNELRISLDNKYLIIDVSVDSQNWYDKVVIDSIIIDNQDTYILNGPSSNPIYCYEVPYAPNEKVYSLPEDCNCSPVRVEEDGTYCFIGGIDSQKHVRLELPLSTLGINPSKDMLFVYAIASGAPEASTPCGLDNNKIMGTVVNLYPFYQQTMCYLKELNNDCQIPKGFIDMILRFKALELCIRTGNYPQAIKYWNKFFAQKECQVIINKCGCNGGNT